MKGNEGWQEIKRIFEFTKALMVVSNLLLFVVATSNAATPSGSHMKSFGEWTAVCTYDDMEETTSCGISSDSKAVSDGFIRGQISIVESNGVFFLDVVISGATPSESGPILRVDGNPLERAIQLGEPSYDVNASGLKYTYLLNDSLEAQATVGKQLRVRVGLDTGDFETAFDLSGYSRAKALVDKWKSSEARP